MTTNLEWQAQVGRSWAESYHQTDRSFAALTRQLLDRIAAHPGARVLDIGCGAGELSLAVAAARPQAQVMGVDISADLVAAAVQRASGIGNLGFAVADAGGWDGPGFAPDLLVSRHGVMFFPDPPAAFANLHRIGAPGASLVFSCFRAPAENTWATELAALLDLPAATDPTAPGPFAFADPRHVERVLTVAGWRDAAFEPVDYAYVAGSGESAVDDAMDFFRRIGPAARTLRALDGPARAQTEARIRAWIEDHRSGAVVAFPAAAWIVTARRG